MKNSFYNKITEQQTEKNTIKLFDTQDNTNEILIGKPVKNVWLKEIRKQIEFYKLKPRLAIIQVGNLPESNLYIKNKFRDAEAAHIEILLNKFSIDISEAEILKRIEQLNKDKKTHGIIVQLPLPAHIDPIKINQAISPSKDVDGFSSENMGKLVLGEEGLIPCTPLGILQILHYYQIELKSKDIVIVGRSNIVGKPLMELLLHEDATVTICHSHTQNLIEKTKQADIVITAIGKSKFFDAQYFKDHQILIDIGTNFDHQGKQHGDIDKEDVLIHLKHIKIVPSPNGCGQTTTAALMYNTFKTALKKERGL